MSVVPIVMGGGSYANIAPPHSIVDVSEYPRPRQLAEHLQQLDSDPALYAEYFWWKEYYTVTGQDMQDRAQPFCR